MLRLPRIFLSLAAATSLLASISEAQATEVLAYGGMQTFDAISGCCVSVPLKAGYGLGLRAEVLDGVYQVFGYTDLKWSEISVLKSHYIKGSFANSDPATDADIKVVRYNGWQTIFSYGAGFFVHTTKQIQYDLPVSVNGFLAVGHLEVQYLVNDKFSVSAVGRGGAAVSVNNLGLIGGVLGGIAYRF